MLTDIKKLHYEFNWFKGIFSAMSRELVDPDSGQPVLFFKMTWKSQLLIYKDKTKQELLLEARRPKGQRGFGWEVVDSKEQDKPIGKITWNVMKSAMKFGAEVWTITGPDGQTEVLKLDAEGDSSSKRILDSMTGLYNPTHTYVVKDLGGKALAHIASKHGWWKGFYDFSLEGGTDDQKKLALALFAAILLMLKK